MRVLVTGGAGYIGSHTAKALARAGHEPVVYDNLSVGNAWAVKWGPLIEGDISDRSRLEEILKKYSITAVIHFAAHAYVEESTRIPERYFRNNVSNTLILLEVLLKAEIEAFVFSSSCAVYGATEAAPIVETQPTLPMNPYGESKLFLEKVLRWYDASHGFRSASLRYFNAAGADPEGEIGEFHEPETHLVPSIIDAALGRRPYVSIFGDNHLTPDGTPVRDFVHVTDLAAAHVLALGHLVNGNGSFAANLGTGRGVSVLEVVRAVEGYAGRSVDRRFAPRRPGDPPVLVADPRFAMKLLKWSPLFSSINQIVDSAWKWHAQFSDQYRQIATTPKSVSMEHARPAILGAD